MVMLLFHSRLLEHLVPSILQEFPQFRVSPKKLASKTSNTQLMNQQHPGACRASPDSALFGPPSLSHHHRSTPHDPSVLPWSHRPEGVPPLEWRDPMRLPLSHPDADVDALADAKGKKKKGRIFPKLLWNPRSDILDGKPSGTPSHEVSSTVSSTVISTKTPLEESHCSSDLSRDAQRVLGGFRQQRESRDQKKRQQKKQRPKSAAGPLCEPDFLGSLVVFPTSFDGLNVNPVSHPESPRPSHQHSEQLPSRLGGRGNTVDGAVLQQQSLLSDAAGFPTRNGTVAAANPSTPIRHHKTPFVAPPPLITPTPSGRSPGSRKSEWNDSRLARDPGYQQETRVTDMSTPWKSTSTPVSDFTTVRTCSLKDTNQQYVPNLPPPPPPLLEPCLSLEIKFLQPNIEVAPGVTLPLRGVEETVVYLMRGKMVRTACWSCGTQLRCMDQAEYVLCPTCRVVAPLEDEVVGTQRKFGTDTARIPRRGVALGLTQAEWLHWKDQLGL